jgi:CheY-like chemotaxis protein
MASGLLQERLPSADRELMSLIEGGARRGAEIIRKLLIFSRSTAGTRGPVQPLHLLKEMSVIMRETFPRNIEIVEDFPSDLSWVSGDSTQLHQVLMNLCVNARDAMPGGGRLTLSASNVMLEEREAALHESTQPGPYVVLVVADTGHGIPPEVRARIFDPYFTTKTVGQGTGLGLSSAFGIVKNHLGFITVDSAPDRGATFKVFLPASPVRTEVPAATAAESPGGGKGRLILVVDDEPAVLLATRKVLEKAGYFVITAADGAQAEKLMEARAPDISLVITDLMMPGMDGVTLVPRLRRLSDKAKFIGVSGQDQAHRAMQLAQLGFDEMLSKPYEPDVLRAAVKRVLS